MHSRVGRIRAWLFVACLTAAASASASLTPSELVIVRAHVAGAQRSNAGAVRAVVARPDLSADESAAALEHTLSPMPVTEARIGFLRELVFGPGSDASRSVLAAAVVRGLLARADAIFDRNPSFEAPSDPAAELFRIYSFLGGDIADAGSFTSGRVHDSSAGIDEATYATCAKALGDHLKRHAATLQPGAALSPIASRIRAQAMLAAFDMGPDSPTRVIDGADRIGLDATRRQLLLARNVLALDSGKNAGALASATAMIQRFPASALAGVEAVWFGEAQPGLRAHRTVLAVGGDLDASTPMSGFPADEVTPSPVPRGLATLADELAFAVTKHALATRGDLALAAQRDAQAAGGDAKKLLGTPRDRAPEAAVAATLAMLLVDAPRTLDLAMARFLARRPESVALVSDAIGVLAAGAGPSGVQSLVLGKGEAGGTSSPVTLSNVRLNPNGTAASFTLGQARWDVARDSSGTPTGVHQGGQPLAFAMLQHARIPISGGAGWTGGGLSLRPLYGSPLVGVVHGPRVRIEGQGDLDVAAMSAPGDDVAFDADVRGHGTYAVLLRASGGHDGLGIGLRVVPGDARTAAKISIVNIASNGTERDLAQGTLPDVDHVHVAVKGGTIRVTCTHRARPPQSASLEAPVPAHQMRGDVALVVKKGTSLELDAVTIRRN